MDNYKKTWLPHLKHSIPKAAEGKGTCMYTMALEGWRRGLDLKFIKKKGTGLLRSVSFSLSDGNKEHIFSGSRGDGVTKKAIKICTDKGLTNKHLAEANVSIPGGKSFSKEATNNQIIKYANTFGYPVVLKPSDSDGGGVGVITNIKNEDELKAALKKARINQRPVIIERFFVGEDFRAYVLNGEVIGAFHRRAASIVGDGISDIKTLLDKKNNERQLSPFLASSIIKIDKPMKNYLEEQGFQESSVPKKGNRVYLRRNGEYFNERDSVNATETITPEMKEIAISAVKAIPGLPHGGVDMLINLEKNEGVVNEVNSRAQISNHTFPVEGKAVDIPKQIIDYYFPETIGSKATDVKYNFDFKIVKDSFDSGIAKEIKVPSIPLGLKSVRRFVVTGENLNTKYRQWLQRQAMKSNLDGYVRTASNNSISVVVAGSEYVVKSFKDVIKKQPFKATKITKIEGKAFQRAVKVGFELRANAKFDNKKSNVKTNSKPVQKRKSRNKQKRTIRLITIPFRVLRKIIRKLK